ncbi:hypothetical protein ACEPAF_9175 [Sanghuangporus sanghuang]
MSTPSVNSNPASFSDKQPLGDEKRHHVTAEYREVDAAAQLSSQDVVDPQDAFRVRRKIDRHVLFMMMVMYMIAFMNKSALGNTAVLGIKTDTHINDTEYNWLGTIYYLSYMIFEYPQNLALQRFPVGKWVSFNILVMALGISLQATCKSFGGMFVLRFIIGMCEASVDAGFMIISAMFYTRREQTTRIGYWFMMNGAAEIVNGCIAFGVLHINSPGFKPWHWLVIICGILTVIASVCFWFLFPDSPTNAWFLTPKERVIAVNRIKTNQAGVENKHFKKEQLIECLTDLKTWIFFFYALFRNVPNSLINQNSIIIQSFGFTTLQTTLLSCINGVVKMSTVFTGVNLAAYLKNGLAYSGVLFYIPSVTCAILVNVLPGSDRAGLLVTQYLVGVEVLGSPIGKAWVTQATAGHTKRITMNAILLIAESLGNTIGPQMWLDRFAPRYHVPWAIIAICYSSAAVLLLIQRYVLNRENKKRDTETPDRIYDDVWIKVTDENGDITEKRVDKAFLDLTDKQNRGFRYVL